jgi:hypothetical protein
MCVHRRLCFLLEHTFAQVFSTAIETAQGVHLANGAHWCGCLCLSKYWCVQSRRTCFLQPRWLSNRSQLKTHHYLLWVAYCDMLKAKERACIANCRSVKQNVASFYIAAKNFDCEIVTSYKMDKDTSRVYRFC